MSKNFNRMLEERTLVIALFVGALAIIPATIYGLTRAVDAGILATVNVLLILLILLLVLGVWESRHTSESV